MCLLRQIVHEAIGSVAVVLSERFHIGPFQERQTWEKKRIFKADVHCSSSSLRSIARPRLSGNARCWIPLPRPRAIIAAMGYVSSTMRKKCNTPLRPRPSHNGPEVQHALFLVWHAANRICAKRLIPFLPTLIEALERMSLLLLSGTTNISTLGLSNAKYPWD
jgi:hypothetical protein